jgi:DNA (cytosine-5)-methyltransferase 1
MVYYNEINPTAVSKLKDLISRGLIAPGDVDTRSVEDVIPSDIEEYDQCHFFAGIGGWSYALRLAGYPDNRRVWTGSCPCQPFSTAGKHLGVEDVRHLWPAWFWLIKQRKPPIVFGEQVDSAIRQGWFDLVSSDLESEDYSVGAASLCAAGVGAPHTRQRLYFVANANGYGNQGLCPPPCVGEMRPWGAFGEMDLQSILDCPFVPGDGFPQPLLRKMVDGIPDRVGRTEGYGNAIVPQVAAKFIKAAVL